MAMKKVISNIFLARIEKNMTQTELGNLLGCSQQYISKLENNESIPSIKTGLEIAKILEKNPKELFLYEQKITIKEVK